MKRTAKEVFRQIFKNKTEAPNKQITRQDIKRSQQQPESVFQPITPKMVEDIIAAAVEQIGQEKLSAIVAQQINIDTWDGWKGSKPELAKIIVNYLYKLQGMLGVEVLFEDRHHGDTFYFNLLGQPYSNEFYSWIGRKAPKKDITFNITDRGTTISGQGLVAYAMFINSFHTELMRRVWEAKKQEQIQRQKPILLQTKIDNLPL